MSNERLLERELEDVDRRESNGDVSPQDARRERADLLRDYREEAHEAAAEAYQRELENW